MQVPKRNHQKKVVQLDQETIDRMEELTMMNYISMNRGLLERMTDWLSVSKHKGAKKLSNSTQRILWTGQRMNLVEYKSGHGYRLTAKGREYLGKENNDD